MAELGERMAALAASFEAEKNYQHDRWHKLDNDLTPIVNLPEKLAREIGKLHGVVDGRIGAVVKELERSMEHAIGRAVKPVTVDVTKLQTELSVVRDRVKVLEDEKQQWSGAKRFMMFVIQVLVSTLSAVGAILAIGRTH